MGTRAASGAAAIVLGAALAYGSGIPEVFMATAAKADWIAATPTNPVSPAPTSASPASPASPSPPAATPTATPSPSPPSPSPPPPTPPGPPPTPPPINWGNPIFTDDFDGTMLSDSWYVYNSPNVRPPIPKRTANSVLVKDGHLELIGHRQKPYGYVSGGVANTTNLTYGRWEVRFRDSIGAGYGAVVLLWPEGTWPLDGEIDLVEVVDGRRQGAGEFLHLGADNRFIGKPIPPTVDFTKWHTIAVDWLPDYITFWLDGKQLWTVQRAAGDDNYIPSTPFHLTLQNDEGCTKRCKPDKKTPAQVIMYVDWVRIYTLPPDVAGTPTPSASATTG